MSSSNSAASSSSSSSSSEQPTSSESQRDSSSTNETTSTENHSTTSTKSETKSSESHSEKESSSAASDKEKEEENPSDTSDSENESSKVSTTSTNNESSDADTISDNKNSKTVEDSSLIEEKSSSNQAESSGPVTEDSESPSPKKTKSKSKPVPKISSPQTDEVPTITRGQRISRISDLETYVGNIHNVQVNSTQINDLLQPFSDLKSSISTNADKAMEKLKENNEADFEEEKVLIVDFYNQLENKFEETIKLFASAFESKNEILDKVNLELTKLTEYVDVTQAELQGQSLSKLRSSYPEQSKNKQSIPNYRTNYDSIYIFPTSTPVKMDSFITFDDDTPLVIKETEEKIIDHQFYSPLDYFDVGSTKSNEKDPFATDEIMNKRSYYKQRQLESNGTWTLNDEKFIEIEKEKKSKKPNIFGKKKRSKTVKAKGKSHKVEPSHTPPPPS